ncbi:MAG: hypothetical protein A2583_04855 [Bdellovibrionales bacterium RIFOXYD1_FULL_53_11]|nr:MAG: hypothetical protein A2583_04855 [Bdellovibrionales bacterium RIFOXYD1_FULL_53_11]
MVTFNDIFLIVFLAFLEGILSIDNALVLAVLAKALPKEQRKKALTYGLAGAVVFRLAALFLVTWIIKYRWVKIAGGLYLVFMAAKHFLFPSKNNADTKVTRGSFWKVVLVIELTDIAFAVDSILAAVALSSKIWVIFTGGFIGVIMMRYAATVFIKVLEKFPSFEVTAYLLVLWIGVKLVLESTGHAALNFHSAAQPAFWIFWGVMAASIAMGFRRGGRQGGTFKP